MPDTATAPAQAGAQADPKQTAANIAKGIQDKAAGKVPPTKDGKQPPVAAPVDPNAGKEKYVVDGKEIWLSPEQARAYVQKGIAFEPRVDQLARLQQETALFLHKLKNDPIQVLTDKRIGLTPQIVLEKVLNSDKIGDDIKESVGMWYWENVVEPTRLSPKDLKAREDAKYREDNERLNKERADAAIQQENRMRVQAAFAQIKANISEAMKDSGLPDNDTPLGTMMARRVADKMRLAYFQRQSLTPKQAIEMVRGELRQFQSALYEHLDEESLVKELGEKNAEKVKKYFLKLVKQADKVGATSGNGNGTEGAPKFKTRDEFFEHLQKLKQGG